MNKVMTFFPVFCFALLTVQAQTMTDFRLPAQAMGRKDVTTFDVPQANGLPVIQIDTENGAEITNMEDYLNMTFVLTDLDQPANNVSKTDMTDQIRGRGHTTWSGANEPGGLPWYPDKKPYRIKFDKKTSLFGLPAAKSWVLLANWYDPTLIKNTFAFELADRLGIPYNHSYHHVELYLNGTYRGNYLLTEHNQVGKGRVDIDETEGWMVKMDFHYDEEPKFKTSKYNLPVIIQSPEFEPADMTNTAYDFVRNDLNQLCDLMASANFPENGYRNLIDIETIVRYFMVALITGIGDFSGPGSVYLYKDKGGKISGGPPWDFDVNFGFSWLNEPVYKINQDNTDHPADQFPYLDDHSFFLRFFQDPVFIAKCREVWNNNYDKILSMSQFIDDMADKIRKSAIENYKVSWLDYPVDFEHWIGELKKFLDDRIRFLDEIYKIDMPPTNVEDSFDSVFNVYPNPFTGEIHLTSAEGCTLQVMSITGSVVHTQKITSPEEIIRLEHLSAGLYIFRVVKDGKSFSVKVIKD